MVDPKKPKPSFSPLTAICKNRFPFAIACPSFIYSAGYVENVRHLAPFVDEIQLLFFESAPQSLPSAELIRELADLAAGEAIGYNVHLPTDVYLGHASADERRRAVEAIRTVVERCQVLSPSTFTLHLERNPAGDADLPVDRWRQLLLESLARALPPEMPSRKICVEALDYPLEWVAPVIEAADLSVCMDMGHLLVHGIDLPSFYENWRARVASVHLHGVDGTGDHRPLDRLSDVHMKTVCQLLQGFTGAVVMENYSPADLDASLACLVDGWSRFVTAGG